MKIQALELLNFRNYERAGISLHPGTNVFYGDNAQGKTNLLEALYLAATAKSHRGAKDREMIRFGEEEAHIKVLFEKKDISERLDMHLKKNHPKGVARNAVPIRRITDLFGILHVVFFSPEDLSIVRSGPGERRRFLDLELCQLDKIYARNLVSYNKLLSQKNKLLKDNLPDGEKRALLEVFNEQMVSYGIPILQRREAFLESMNDVVSVFHSELTDHKENLSLSYHKSVKEKEFADTLAAGMEKELVQRMSLFGPHRDDFRFLISGENVRIYGSQGQKRSAALSLKLGEIQLVKEAAGEEPVLLLDDVLSELDSMRQNQLLERIGSLQTIITCTGLKEMEENRFHIDQLFTVKEGKIKCHSQKKI